MFSNEVRLNGLINRKRLLKQRDPVANANIIRKLDRQIRKLTQK